MAAVLAGLSDVQSASVKEWFMRKIDSRMKLAGTAVQFIHDLDTKQVKVIEALGVEMGRMNERLSETNLRKDGIGKTFADLQQSTPGRPLSPRRRRPTSQLEQLPTPRPSRRLTMFTAK